MTTVLLSGAEQMEALKLLFEQRLQMVMQTLDADDDDDDAELDLDEIKSLIASVGSLDGFLVQEAIPVQEPESPQETSGSKSTKNTKNTKNGKKVKKTKGDGEKKKGPKRPTSSFILFRKDQKEQLSKQVDEIQSKQKDGSYQHGDLFFNIETKDKDGNPKECDSNPKIVSKIWKNMTDEEKEPFEKMAQQDKERYQREKEELSASADDSS